MLYNNTCSKLKYHFYNHWSTGNWLTDWRSTGSTFVYTLFVRLGDECSRSLCVTTVETPFWASRKPKVFLRSWNFKSVNPAFLQIFLHRLWLKLSLNNFSCPISNSETYLESSAITEADTGREPILFLVFLLEVVIELFSKSISLILNDSMSLRLRPAPRANKIRILIVWGRKRGRHRCLRFW